MNFIEDKNTILYRRQLSQSNLELPAAQEIKVRTIVLRFMFILEAILTHASFRETSKASTLDCLETPMQSGLQERSLQQEYKMVFLHSKSN